MSTPETTTPDPATTAEPTPLLPFERWAQLSALLLKRSADERLDILEEQEIDPAAWTRNDRHWTAQLADDLDRGDEDRPERYAALCAEELRARNEKRHPAGAAAPAPQAPPESKGEIEAASTRVVPADPPVTTSAQPDPVLAPSAAAPPPPSFATPVAAPFATPPATPPSPSFATPPAAPPSPSFATPPAVVAPPAVSYAVAEPPAAPPAVPPAVTPPAAPPLVGKPVVTPKPAALAGTMAAGVMPIPGRALPFGNKPSQNIAEPAPAPPAPKPGVSGETLPLGASLMAFVTPFAKTPSPAAKAPSPTAQPPSAQATPAHPALAQTAPAQAAPALAQTAPAQAAPAQPAPTQPISPAARTSPATPEMTLDAYASLCAEMVVHPQHRADILRRYSLADEAALHALHTQWRERFSRDPALEAQWQTKYKTFRDWLAQRR